MAEENEVRYRIVSDIVGFRITCEQQYRLALAGFGPDAVSMVGENTPMEIINACVNNPVAFRNQSIKLQWFLVEMECKSLVDNIKSSIRRKLMRFHGK